MTFLCLEISYQTADLAAREPLSLTQALTEAAYLAFERLAPATAGIDEIYLLSTCNRTEIWAALSDEAPTQSDAVSWLVAFLGRLTSTPTEHITAISRVHVDEDAIQHACRVACGLESQVLGEAQILGQIAGARLAADGSNAFGQRLALLLQTAIRTGKRARTETAIAQNALSIGSIAVRALEDALGPLADREIAIIGVGEIGRLTLKALRSVGATRLTLLNRTLTRAEALAAAHGISAVALDALPEQLARCDAIVSATSAPDIVIDVPAVIAARAQRQAPLYLVDLAVPRDVAPAVASLPGVTVLDMEMMTDRRDAAYEQRVAAIPQVEAIIAAEIALLQQAVVRLAVRPTIAELYQKAESIRQREISRMLRHLPDADEEVTAQLDQFSKSLVKKLLHEPTTVLRREAETPEIAAMVRTLFGL